MKKILLLLVVAVLLTAIFVACDDGKNGSNNGQSGAVTNENVQISPEEQLKKDTEVIKVDNTDFMERSGYKLTKSADLSDVTYSNIYSQSKDRAQIDLEFSEDRKATLTLDKTNLYSESQDNQPDVYLIANTEVTFLVGDDGLKTYYFKKGSVYYSFSTYDAFSNEEMFNIVGGFDTEIGDNF